LAAFLLNFSGCGLLFSWGIYQSLYEEMSLEKGNPFSSASSADITLIGSIAASLMKIGPPFAVAWSKQFSPRLVVCSGGVIYSVASGLASFGTALWHFQLAQGLSIGIGTCLSFMPSMAVPPCWFGKHRGVNMGIISAGTGIGGLVWSPILTACIQTMGYRDAIRRTGCLCTIVICLSGFALDWEPSTAAKFRAERSQRSLLKGLFHIPFPTGRTCASRRFVAQSINAALQSAAYYTPIFYIASYSKSLGYSSTQGSNFTALSNACNAIGKVGVDLLPIVSEGWIRYS
jgi:MFS family permease